MSDEIAGAAPSLPNGVLLVTTAILSCLLIFVFWRTRNRTANFIVFAIWARYMMSAFHSVTFGSSPLGLTWNALGSCLIFGAGLLVIDRRLLGLRYFLPVYALTAVIILSGIANRDIAGTLNAVVKYGYLLVLACGTYEALGRYGEQRFLRLLLWAFVPLIVFQGLSLLLGVAKATESDSSVSYIGGYNHEGAFSIALATAFIVVALIRDMGALVKGAWLGIILAGLLLANYRTSILAIVPSLFAQFAMGTAQMFPKRQRLAIGIVMALICLVGIVVASILMEERFRDVATLASSWANFVKPPQDYTISDREVMSGRLMIWSEYLYAYAGGTDLQKLLGFGANSWVGVFSNYAHNTLISQLYEYGVLGVLALIYLWASMFFTAVRVVGGARAKLVAAHASFILLSFATMPLWMIEGYIYYGLLCGYTLFFSRHASYALPRLVPRAVDRSPGPAAAVSAMPAMDRGMNSHA